MDTQCKHESAIGRRTFLRRTFQAAVGGALSTSVGAAWEAGRASAASASNELVYAGFGGVYEQKLRRSVLGPFQRATGIQVRVTTGAFDVAKLKVMVQTGHVEWDVVDATGPTLGQFIAEGLLEEVDYSTVNTAGLIDRAYANEYGLGYYAYSHNIFWNTNAIKGPLTSWTDVWNIQRFPGKRGFLNGPDYALEESLLADGVPKDRLYPLDVDRAFRAFDKIRHSAVFLDINTLTNQVAQQDVVTGDLNLTRVQQAIKDGVPITYNWKQTIVDINRFAIPKGAKNRDNVLKLMNFVLRPETQVQIFKILGYSPAVKQAFDQIPLDAQKNLAASPVTKPESIFINVDWWAAHGADVRRRFQQWLLKG